MTKTTTEWTRWANRTRGVAAVLCVLSIAASLGCARIQRDRVARAYARAASDQTPAIARSLNAWHAAAGNADFDSYFGLMTADAVFLGTDATERWDREEFEVFAKPYFDSGRGWLYEPIGRKIIIAVSGKTAWFDERLSNAGLGECRGTGVVEIGPDKVWRVAHYSLTIPIPNALAKGVAVQIRGFTAGLPGSTESAAAGNP